MTTGGSPGPKRRTNTNSPKPPVSSASATRKSSFKSSGRASASEFKSKMSDNHVMSGKNAGSKSNSVDSYRSHQTTEQALHKKAKRYDKTFAAAEIKETVVVTSTTTNLAVPKPSRSSQGGGQKSSRRSGGEKCDEEKDGDNLSETGTYTIESDTVSKEIEDARRSIDQAFGIEDGQEGGKHRLLDSNGNIEEMADTDEDNVGEELPHDSPGEVTSSSLVAELGEDGSTAARNNLSEVSFLVHDMNII